MAPWGPGSFWALFLTTNTPMTAEKQRVLLVNPNRYRHPPVAPLGLEYLAHGLQQNDFEVSIADLCFSKDAHRELGEAIRRFSPHAVGLTIRNIDSVLFPDTDFFLPEIRALVDRIRRVSQAPVIVGGAAMPADPEGILRFVGADVAVLGPGETTLPAMLKKGIPESKKGRVVIGAAPASDCPKRGVQVDYRPYLDEEGLAGFETHKGCSSMCVYCIEAGTQVNHREPSDILCELRQLADGGITDLHLCDTEFNEDLDYCLALLEVWNRETLGLRWALYMKPGNSNQRLFELLRSTGAYLVTLSVDTFRKSQGYWSEIETMVARCRAAGIRISIDLLTGFPYETESELGRCLDFFRRIGPDEVVVNVHLRLYKNLAITQLIENDPALKRHVVRSDGENGSPLAPVFYNHVPPAVLRARIGEDRRFRIAGAEKVVNYQKL